MTSRRCRHIASAATAAPPLRCRCCPQKEMDVGGLFKYDFGKASKAMRPSPTMNKIIDN
jgi:hypothetical protein